MGDPRDFTWFSTFLFGRPFNGMYYYRCRICKRGGEDPMVINHRDGCEHE